MPDGLRVWFGGNLELLANFLYRGQQKSDQDGDNSNVYYKNIHYKSVPPGLLFPESFGMLCDARAIRLLRN